MPRVALAAPVIFSAVLACTPPPSRVVDLDAERAELLRRDREWAELAARGGDVEQVIAYWTDDAVVMPPGQPAVEGKAALREYVGQSFAIPGFRITWRSDDVEVSPDGMMAWARGVNEVTVPGADGQPMVLHGRAITVWRKGADGQWRCAADIWNAAPPDASASAPASGA